MIIALVLVLVAVGSVWFHFISPWWWTPIASNWGYVDTTLVITFWITGAVFVAVLLFTAYCVLRFRHREGRQALYEPENKKLEWWLTVATAIGVAAMLAPGLYVWHQFVTRSRSSPGNGRGAIACPARTAASARRTCAISAPTTRSASIRTTPTPRTTWSSTATTCNLHLQIGKPVKFLLRSVDVLHNFYVPEFRGKMDMIPGAVTYYWVTPTRTGTFDILCFELCGVGHSQMRSQVVVAEAAPYQAWLEQQKTFAELSGAPTMLKASYQPASR
jgi:cytochrome c oxidase subunit 2